MKRSAAVHLSRRESQIMEVVYALGRATAAEVRGRMPDPPSYSTVRALLRVLEEKGHLRHEQDGPRYIYLLTVPRERAVQAALRRLVRTFFDGSTEQAAAALLRMPETELPPERAAEIARRIEKARKEGR